MSQSINIIKDKIDELPNNIEAEQSVIGSILLSNEIFDEINILISNKNSDNFFCSSPPMFACVKTGRNSIRFP